MPEKRHISMFRDMFFFPQEHRFIIVRWYGIVVDSYNLMWLVCILRILLYFMLCLLSWLKLWESLNYCLFLISFYLNINPILLFFYGWQFYSKVHLWFFNNLLIVRSFKKKSFQRKSSKRRPWLDGYALLSRRQKHLLTTTKGLYFNIMSGNQQSKRQDLTLCSDCHCGRYDWCMHFCSALETNSSELLRSVRLSTSVSLSIRLPSRLDDRC